MERAESGLVVVGVLIENARGEPPTAEDLRSWTGAYGITFPVLGDPEQSVFTRYVPTPALPTYLVIDREGVVRFRAQGAAEDAESEAKLRAAIGAASAGV